LTLHEERLFREGIFKIVGNELRLDFRQVNHIPKVRSGKSPTTRWAKDEVAG
jgi:hypothetical protein